MHLTTVIPVHNRATLIREALLSVFGQTLLPNQVVVVDDGSTDDLATALEPFRARLELVSQSNRGPAAARNAGLRLARGSYIAFLDSDDLWFPWTLSTYVQAINRTGSPAVVMGAVTSFSRSTELDAVRAQEPSFRVWPDYFASARAEMFRGSGAGVFRKSALEEIGGFHETPNYCEDIDLLLRLGLHGPFVNVETPILLARREHGAGSVSQIEKTFAGIREIIHRDRAELYPGGPERKTERRTLIATQAHAVVFWCIQRGKIALAWKLYTATAAHDLIAGNLGFLARAILFMMLAATGLYGPLRTLSRRVRAA